MADRFVLFKRTKDVELKMSDFLNNIIQAGLVYVSAMDKYCEKGANSDFIDLRNQLTDYERKNDDLRRTVEIQLYVQMILPDVRSDILRLLEGCDRVINLYEENLIDMSVEELKLPKNYQDAVLEMVKSTCNCAANMVDAAKSFLSGEPVETFVKQVSFCEHEVDMQAMEMKRKIFKDSKLTLAQQLQLRDFIRHIERISDNAEDMADRISVIAVKHAL